MTTKPATPPEKIERINLTIRNLPERCAVARVYEGGIETDAYPSPEYATAFADALVDRYMAYPRLMAERAELEAALRSFLDASDQFVRDTGLKHGDLITERAEDARKVLRKLGAE